ncbi:MAG: Hsp20/alpha crystallin family protein [Anaerolineales bacterium]|nr:Hsp20/alpha crystallin family protein [Anaerolineae bacterium]PWB77992.1 MAG: Hsp20/alpha crystallin family protein [Anaerolineales bacterium]
MPTIVRKSIPVLVETHRDVYSAVSWRVRSNVWRPPTDVYETEDSFVVRLEIAGLKDEDIEVLLQENTLIVTGGRSDSSERRAYHQMEIPFGKFSVGIELPASIDSENVSAEYKDGFLTIHLPRKKTDI